MGVEVCPVHKAELKSSYISSIHVGAMSQNSQPGGQKRKRPDDEDEDEDPPSAPRRQLHFDVRQQILDLTYTKLERFKQNPDTKLSRYVLIINTIRNLEQEMLKDGIKVGPPGSFVPSANHQVPFDAIRPPLPDDATRTNLPNVEDAISVVSYSSNPYPMDTETRTASTSVINSSDAPSDIFIGVNGGASYSSEYDRYLMDLDGPSSGRATPFVRSDVESGALWNDDSDRLTSLNWSSVLKMVDGGSPLAISPQYPETAIESSTTSCNFDASSNSSSGCSSDCSNSDDAMSCSETSLHTLMPVTTGIPTCMNNVGACSSSSSSSPKVTSASGSASSQSGSSPPNSEDEIFGDIDLALYDYDFTPLSPPNVKMAPVSAEELMGSLSPVQRDKDNLIHTNNYYKKDFCGEEREHLTSVRT